MKTKLDIISGFLGAGKTTLIKKLLEEKLYDEKVAIIENEFGEIGIDGNLLKKNGIRVKEINSGCICCTLTGDFTRAIKEVMTKYHPERLLIEPSGVGKLSDVIKACEAPDLKEILTINMLITVIDVLKFKIYMDNFGEFYENQVKNAKTIILSRTQNVDHKQLQTVIRSIKKLNREANIITTPWKELDAAQIMAVAERHPSASLEWQLKTSSAMAHPHNCQCGCHHGHSHDAPEVFDVWGIETPQVFDEKELSSIVDSLGNKRYGLILRGKGILQLNTGQWLQFDYIPGEYAMNSSASDYTGRLCIIGNNLNKKELGKLFRVPAEAEF
jgi:G3E family GTPase